jgi:hypothetical protein
VCLLATAILPSGMMTGPARAAISAAAVDLAFMGAFAVGPVRQHADLPPGFPFCALDPRPEQDVDALVAEQIEDRRRDVRVLAPGQLRSPLDHGHP